MNESTKKKADYLNEIGRAWAGFMDFTRGIPREEQTVPNAVGHWSVKDTLLHVAAWDDELIKIVQKHRSTGEETDYGADALIDALNESQVEEKRGLSLDQTWAHLEQTHDKLMEFLNSSPGDAFEPGTYTGDWIATDSAGHYREHLEDIKRWVASRS